jgi:hypothetical protein
LTISGSSSCGYPGSHRIALHEESQNSAIAVTVQRAEHPNLCKATIGELSSVGELHPHALPKPDVNLSAHPAPIDQP